MQLFLLALGHLGMKVPALFFLVTLLACGKIKLPTPAPPTVILSGWHLKSKSIFGCGDTFKLNDVVLQFDSIKPEVTITGNKPGLFFTNGVYPYNIVYNDTAFSYPNPRDPKQTLYWVYNKLELPSLTKDYIILRGTTMIFDPNFGMADDEVYYHFEIH